MVSINELATFTVFSGSNISYVDGTLDPTTATPGENVTMTVALFDSGTASLTLLPDSTWLEIDFSPAGSVERTYLGGNFALPANDSALVSFLSTMIPDSITPGFYPIQLHVAGTPSINPNDTLVYNIALTDQLQILIPGALSLYAADLTDTEVSQGETGQVLTFKLQNTGDGSARINSADSIQIATGSQYTLNRTSAQIFPLTIATGDSAIFTYNIAVDNNAVTGPDTFNVSVGYNDVASGRNFTVTNPAVYGDWNVLEKTTLNVVAVNAAAVNVSQGQTGLAVELQIENTGAVPGIIGSASNIGIQFTNNNNTVIYVSPVLPDTIAPLATNSYNFTVNINAAAATGIDSLRGFVNGRNLRTNALASDVSSSLDAWLVQLPPQVIITRVFSPQSTVNSGQQNLNVELRL